MKHAIFAGSFDPFTNGHLWTFERGLTLFDRITVAVGVNHEKRPFMSGDERQALVEKILEGRPTIRVVQFSGQFLAQYALQQGARFILRGIRNSGEYAYEQRMAQLNREIAPNVTTVHCMAPAHLTHISGSVVRGVMGLTDWETVVAQMVPAHTLTALLEKYHDTH